MNRSSSRPHRSAQPDGSQTRFTNAFSCCLGWVGKGVGSGPIPHRDGETRERVQGCYLGLATIVGWWRTSRASCYRYVRRRCQHRVAKSARYVYGVVGRHHALRGRAPGRDSHSSAKHTIMSWKSGSGPPLLVSSINEQSSPIDNASSGSRTRGEPADDLLRGLN